MTEFSGLRVLATLCAVSVATQGAAGASERLKLSDELCEYSVTFDPQKVSKVQIKSTFDFLTQPFASVFAHPVFSAEAVKSIDLAKIDIECAESLKNVKSTPLLPLDGLEAYRSDVIAEIEDSCRYDRLDAEGFRNPSVLRKFAPAATCMAYVDALEGKSDLRALYEKVVRRQCAQNANPKTCLADARKNLGDLEEMKVYVHNFGWNHCAIDFNLRNTEKNAEKAQKLFKAFLKTYKPRKLSCSEP